MNKKLLQRIEEIFLQRLSAKTGWGKNEVEIIYKDSVNEALMETVDKQQEEIDIMTSTQ